MSEGARRDALLLARAAAARAGSLEELAPGRALGLSEEEVREARAGRVPAGALTRVSEAVAILDIAVALGYGRRSRSAALVQCEQRLESVERELWTAREELVGALRARQSCAAEVARRSREREVLAQAAVLALVEQAERILRLPAVRRLRVVSYGEQPEFEVSTFALVFDADGVARSAGSLRFRVMSRPPRVQFDITDGVSPHPHVMSSGRPCLGHAAEAVHSALVDEEFEGAIALISGFLLDVIPATPRDRLRASRKASAPQAGTRPRTSSGWPVNGAHAGRRPMTTARNGRDDGRLADPRRGGDRGRRTGRSTVQRLRGIRVSV